MSRAFIAFYMGDYDRDTQALSTLEHGAYFLLLKQCWVHGSIPLEPARRASIAKLSLREWNRIAPAIDPFFDEEGRNKRATREIEKAEEHRIKHVIAGRRGGEKSAISRAKKRSIATSGATSSATSSASGSASSGAEPIKNRNITTTFSVAARASENPEKPPEIEPNEAKSQAANPAAAPQGLAMEARKAVQKAATSIGSGELIASIQAKRWIDPC